MPTTSRNTTRLIAFMNEMTFNSQQRFIVHGNKVDRVPFSDTDFEVFFVRGKFLDFLKLIKHFFLADKIVVHGFFNFHLILFSWFFPKILKKMYWVVWGGDLYSVLESAGKTKKVMIKNAIKKLVLRRIDNIITYVPGDFYLVKENLNPEARLHVSIMYPGNLYKDFDKDFDKDFLDDGLQEARILVGNSGSPSNNHIRIFERLKKHKDVARIKVFCPLSYGDQDYIDEVCNYGESCFGERFIPLTEYMDLNEYVEFLSSIKYAVYDYDRQQGMGNIISLLGLGKGVFLNPQTTPWGLFKEKNIDMIDVNDLESFDFTMEFISDNPNKIKESFSSQVLESQLYKIFN
jgi:hypothetical protein